jgi:hypothetical protein
MRGSPLLQALFLAVVLALAGFPVWSLTRPKAAQASVQVRETVQRRSVDLAISATGDARLVLTEGGTEIWSDRTTPAGVHATLNLPVGETELVATVAPSGGTGAVRLQFSEDGESLADVTVWGENTEVISLPASPVTP